MKASDVSIESVGYYSHGYLPQKQRDSAAKQPEVKKTIDWLQHEFPADENLEHQQRRRKELQIKNEKPKRMTRKGDSFRAVGL